MDRDFWCGHSNAYAETAEITTLVLIPIYIGFI